MRLDPAPAGEYPRAVPHLSDSAIAALAANFPEGSERAEIAEPEVDAYISLVSIALRATDEISAPPRSRPNTIERLLSSLLPHLQRWTHGKLPTYARRRMDTGDLVQEAVVHVLRQLGEDSALEPEVVKRYVLKCIFNRIRDEIRRARLGEVRGGGGLSETPDSRDTPLDEAIESQEKQQYREALLQLDEDDQVLLVGRVDLGLSYEELATATGKPNAEAARSAARRAAFRLAARITAKP
ncbi:MAG: sigma-70 family RNA polymerase sigma factor [Thermoanaerobaculia bacterium]